MGFQALYAICTQDVQDQPQSANAADYRRRRSAPLFMVSQRWSVLGVESEMYYDI
jgi:hypothetical protein